MGNAASKVKKFAVGTAKVVGAVVVVAGAAVTAAAVAVAAPIELAWAAVAAAAYVFATSPRFPAPMPQGMSQEDEAETRRRAREDLGMDTVHDYNIAHFGQVKTGKSSMMNAIRSVKKGEPGWAPVGETRCTAGKSRPYRFTVDKDKQLYAFDSLLQFLGDTPRKEDLEYARLAIKYKVPFAFVRSRCDRDLRDRVKQDGQSLEDAKRDFLAENREAYKKELRRGGEALADVPLFFVSAVSMAQIVDGQPAKYLLEEAALLKFVVDSARARRGAGSPPPSEDE